MVNLMWPVNGSQNTKTINWSMIALGAFVTKFLFKISIDSVDVTRTGSHS